ncbi:PREDICTED: pinin-like [Camelina sativa]|uniref:Pinin-like n=1 Tax=Camelina sativa TaxID=90675 RepID=A0ABM0WAA3_CAMSA|nr:PREDICTED: pinin-like [Camelina sativa]
METETEIKEEQWNNSICSFSSSRCSSITSESSDGHFDIRHFPLPKPSLSASEAQKLRESHQAYDPNRIPSSVFSSKPGNPMEWSIASNESLFSIHDGAASGWRSAEMITQNNPVPVPLPLPPVKKPNESEKETINGEEEPYQVEISDSEVDDNDDKEEKMSEVESDDEYEEMIEAEVLVETETKVPKEKEVVEVVKENKPEDSTSTVSHSPSISCRSDTSNNSIASFAFQVLPKEDVVIKTPSMEIKGNVIHKQRPEYQLPLSPVLPPQPQPQRQPQPYAESSTLTDLQPESQPQPQREGSEKFESRTQSVKASRMGWFSCFQCPSKCGFF